MNNGTDHNRVITQAAGSVLKPLGLFQKGRSRLWIDDNGWFLILAEFQPSGWSKGSYLNVAIHYLWRQQDYFTFDYGGREGSFVGFQDDETAFFDDIVTLAERAAEKVKEYRGFRELSYARKRILGKKADPDNSHDLYAKMMICGLAKDAGAIDCYRQLLRHIQSPRYEWEYAYRAELTENIAEIIRDADSFQAYIAGKVAAQRSFWRSKSSMKKLKSP